MLVLICSLFFGVPDLILGGIEVLGFCLDTWQFVSLTLTASFRWIGVLRHLALFPFV